MMRCVLVPDPPSILVNLCHVDSNVITVAWQQGHVLTGGNDVSYVLDLDDGDSGPFRVRIANCYYQINIFANFF